MMTYNDGTCALQFPSHYVPVTEEEMTYVDGGWSASVFAKNIAGIWNKTTAARHALRGQGISWSILRQWLPYHTTTSLPMLQQSYLLLYRQSTLLLQQS